MDIVISIPKELKQKIDEGLINQVIINKLWDAAKNGTVLPKQGLMIDTDGFIFTVDKAYNSRFIDGVLLQAFISIINSEYFARGIMTREEFESLEDEMKETLDKAFRKVYLSKAGEELD